MMIVRACFHGNGDQCTEKHPIKIKKARNTCNSKNRVVNLTNLEKSGRKLTRSK